MSFRDLWSLDPHVAFLNHGSFGACPGAILEFQRALQDEMERDPVDYLARSLSGRLAEVRSALAPFVGADPDDLAFVPNATAGVNAVVRSIALEPGDELLTTNHAYGACLKTLQYVAGRCGARVRVADVPFPLTNEDQVIVPIVEALSPRTRLVMVDHVTSPTALVYPINRIVDEVRKHGVDVLVDGAHALGMVPIRLDELGAAYYTANAHKWLCAPKGAAFLHVRKDRQSAIHAACISHGFDPANGAARFREEFDWTGTLDPTPWLCIPACIRFFEGLVPGGWDGLMKRNHALVWQARGMVLSSLGFSEPCPEPMIGAMASIPLPIADKQTPLSRLNHEELTNWFRTRNIDAWFFPWGDQKGKLVRLSAQLYNREEDYRRFIEGLRDCLRAN